ncbi:MAG: ribonuclease J [Alphaproteobacteria bacterium]
MDKKYDKGLYFIPLGGVGEIGMNLYLYGCDNKWIAVDMGIGFAGDDFPGIDIMMVDPTFIEERRKDFLGVVVTHAHEDHIGAIAHLWSKIKFPVYATPFAAEMLEPRLDETGLLGRVDVDVLPLNSTINLGPFEIRFISVTHSIPEANALFIKTPYGNIVHSGDWKFDTDPLIGEESDYKTLKSVGKEGVLAFVCDSTNVLVEGKSKSESEVRNSLVTLFSKFKKRIAVACFSSNVARIESIAWAAKANGRQVCLVGRSLWKVEDAAKAVGYLDGVNFLTESEAGFLPENEILYICTGSQGETGSALLRIASDNHKHIYLDEGDVVIFSSRVIPGNEKSILKLQNILAEKKIEIITGKDELVHVSGHPPKEEIRKMYGFLKPKIAIPIHGEPIHLIEHEKLALSLGVDKALRVNNGQVIKFEDDDASVIDEFDVGILVLDGNRLVSLDSNLIKMRRKIMWNSSAVVSVAIDKKGNVKGNIQISAPDLLEDIESPDILQKIIGDAQKSLAKMLKEDKLDDGKVSETLRLAVRHSFTAICGKKPLINVHVIRI